MYERFTDASREVMRLAAEEAARWNHEYVGTEHMLIALALSGTHPGGAILHQCGINSDKVRSILSTIELPLPDPPGKWARLLRFATGLDRSHTSPRAKHVVERAMDAARQDGRHTIGTEHLLQGLLCDEESVGYSILANNGCDITKLRDLVELSRAQARLQQ